MKTAFKIIISNSEFPNIRSAISFRFSPKLIEILAAAPAPTNIPNADASVVIGKVNASPDIANGPTP